jgi:rSAM/selenodomain-associated transferase 1
MELAIFTRYPRPGHAKTRLIPKLGANGAAQLHSQLVKHTLKQARGLQQSLPIQIKIYYTGASLESMTAWLGAGLDYQIQVDGDLGTRLEAALDQAWLRQIHRLVIIGTDCPSLDVHILGMAFHLLDQGEVVIGPAVDGGYYLIGFNLLMLQGDLGKAQGLLRDMPWSSDRLLAETQAKAAKLQLQINYLPVLADIDRPEDLARLDPDHWSFNPRE